MEINIVWLFH